MRQPKYFVPLLFLVANVVLASPTPYTTVYVEAAAHNRTTNPYYCSDSGSKANSACTIANYGILTENSSQGDAWYGLTNTASGAAHAWVDNLGLHAYVQQDLAGYPIDRITSYTHYSSSFLNSGIARASWSDTITPNKNGDLLLTFALDGSKYTFGSANAWADVLFTSNYGQAGWSLGRTQFSNAILPLAQQFNYTLHNVQAGQSITYTLQLDAKVQVGASLVNNTPMLVTDSAVADFSNTLNFYSIDLQDSLGNSLNSGFSLTSTSGYNYDQFVGAASAVPEPSTVLPLAAGLAFLLRRARGLRR